MATRKSIERKKRTLEAFKQKRINSLNARGIANKCEQCGKEGRKLIPITLRDGEVMSHRTEQNVCPDCLRKIYKQREIAEHHAIVRKKHELAEYKRRFLLKGGLAKESQSLKSKHAMQIHKQKHPGLVNMDGELTSGGELPKVPRKPYGLRKSTRNVRRQQRKGE